MRYFHKLFSWPGLMPHLSDCCFGHGPYLCPSRLPSIFVTPFKRFVKESNGQTEALHLVVVHRYCTLSPILRSNLQKSLWFYHFFATTCIICFLVKFYFSVIIYINHRRPSRLTGRKRTFQATTTISLSFTERNLYALHL